MMATPPKPRVRSEYLASTATRCFSAFAKTLGLKRRDHRPRTRFSPSQTSALTIGGSILGVQRCIGRLHSQQGIASGAGSRTSLWHPQ